MLIGAMNHPARDVLDEIRWIAELGLEFIDLTLEPPAAASWLVKPEKIRRAIDDAKLRVVGHTAYYLPMASAIPEVRTTAVREFTRCIEVFAQVGAKWMNIHPDAHTPMHDRSFFIEQNRRTLEELFPVAERNGVGLMIENLPGPFNTPEQVAELLDPYPQLGLHLDIGHANLRVAANTTRALLDAFGSRVQHVHLHDNKGNADLHLPLGAGTMDFRAHLGALHATGYDGTITLEVFTADPHYLAYSRDVVRKLWTELGQ